MTLTATPAQALADGSVLVAFDGPALRTVEWSVTSGPGRIVPLASATDATGRAWAVYYPDGGSGTARVRCAYGA